MKLKIPKENANDDFVTISKIFVQDGQLVQQGDLLLEFETSKATIEYEASISGVIYFENIEIGTQMNVDTVFGEILKEPKKNKTKLSKTKLENEDTKTKSNAEILHYSDTAQKLKDGNLEIKTSNKWVTSKDFVTIQPSNNQKINSNYETIVIKNSSPKINFSKKEITKSKILEIEALSTNTLSLNSTIGIEIELKQRRKTNDFFYDSILDIVIYETTLLLRGEFSDLNSCYLDENHIALYEDVVPGFAIDNKNNLTVVSIPKFKTLKNLSETMTNIIIRFDEKKLTAKDLMPTTFTVTDLSTTKVNFVLPLINGYQAFIIGICRSNKGYQILGTFDHRVTEGKRFSKFLEELRRRVKLFAIKNFEPITCYYCLKTIQDEQAIGNRGFIKIIDDNNNENLICRNCFDGV